MGEWRFKKWLNSLILRCQSNTHWVVVGLDYLAIKVTDFMTVYLDDRWHFNGIREWLWITSSECTVVQTQKRKKVPKYSKNMFNRPKQSQPTKKGKGLWQKLILLLGFCSMVQKKPQKQYDRSEPAPVWNLGFIGI